MKLTFIRKWAESGETNCPAVYQSDRETFVVQGWRVTDPDTLAQLDIPPHESVVEVPVDVLRELLGRKDES